MTGRAPRLVPVDAEDRWKRIAWVALAAYGAALAWLVLIGHRTATYGVESDLMGVYIPAARALRAGRLVAEHYQFHGIGYPALLALVGGVLAGNDWLAARVLNVVSALVAAFLTFELVSTVWSRRTGLVAMLALMATPVFVWSAVEAGTDLPALALSLGATLLLMRGERAWTLALSGLLAGLAIVTRYNAVFLPIAGLAVLLLRPKARRASLAYAAGVAVPVVTWLAIEQRSFGATFSNENYANIAYEFFGRSVPWERFWVTTRGQFHSFADLVRYDPARFFAHLATNLVTRWWRDAYSLMSPWLGFLALPGLVFMLPGRPRARAIALHAALAYGVLAFAFYAPRFFLYLLPFYLGGAVALALDAGWPPWRNREVTSGKPGVPRRGVDAVAVARAGLVALAILASGAQAVRGTQHLLAAEPVETRLAGEWLRGQGLHGRIFARKPHVAYFAGMEYVPLPASPGLGDLLRGARAGHVEFLFVSTVERVLRPQLAALDEGGVPGLALLHQSTGDPQHRFSVFRITGGAASDAALDSALVAASRRYAARPEATPSARLVLAGNLLNQGRAREALEALAEAERLEPRNPMVARWQALAWAALQDHARTAAACERAIALGSNTAWEQGHLGMALLMQARYPDARERLRAAVEKEPANFEYVDALGIASYYTGDLESSLEAFERALALRPGDEEALYYAARILVRAGRRPAAIRLLTDSRAVARFTSPELAGLADSLGVPRDK